MTACPLSSAAAGVAHTDARMRALGSPRGSMTAAHDQRPQRGGQLMSHGITSSDQMFSVRKVPWRGLGAVLAEYPESIDEALEKAWLGWKVTNADLLVVKAPGW